MKIKRYIKKFAWSNFIGIIRDGLAMQRIQPLIAEGPYIPWSDSALGATAVSIVLNDIVVNSRSTIVECGGGVSTICIGALLKQLGRTDKHLYTIEHDESWIGILNRMIRQHRVSDYVTIVHAPLTHTSLSWDDARWYDEDVLELELQDESLDMLLVDGPPAHQKGRQYARYPAVPFFEEKFSNNFSVIIDDIDRSPEYDIARQWGEILEVGFDDRVLSGNISIATCGDSYHI